MRSREVYSFEFILACPLKPMSWQYLMREHVTEETAHLMVVMKKTEWDWVSNVSFKGILPTLLEFLSWPHL